MPKITIKRDLETIDATCNFCGEEKDECIRGSEEVSVSIEYRECITEFKTLADPTKMQDHLERVRPAFRAPYWKMFKWPQYDFNQCYKIITGEEKKIEENSESADICTDCIRELARALPKQ